jgi:4-hydroxy-tetrahydrodipicolinate synthase
VKDAKKDVVASAQVMAETQLLYYSGDDAMTIPLLSVGAVGVIGTSTHFTGRRTQELIRAFRDGRTSDVLRLYRALLPVYTGVFATQGCILVKSGLAHVGIPVGGLRAPLLEASPAQAAAFNALLDAADL